MMSYKSFTILLGLLLTIGTALVPATVQAAGFTVTRVDDPPPDGCKPNDCSLREAIIAANISAGADTITIPADTFTLSIAGSDEDAAATGDLDITGSVTIVGVGTAGLNTTTIDAAGTDRIFEIAANANVKISDLVITGGKGVILGGGINNSGTLLLEDAIITDNLAMLGGGIYNNGPLTLIDVVISDNKVGFSTGLWGGGIYNDTPGSLTVTGSTFNKNYARFPDSVGGAIANVSTLSVSNTSFDMNAADSGGAIYNAGSTATATLTEVTFTDNIADGLGTNSNISHGGGAIINDEGTLSLTRSTVNGNSSGAGGGAIINDEGTLSLTHSTVSDNSSGPIGGGILNDTGTLTVTASSIYSNSATIAGGGIANLAGELFKGKITLNDSTVSGNFARDIGGGIFNDGFGATLNLSYVTVVNNTVNSGITGSGGGGGIFNMPPISFPIFTPGGNANLKGTLLAGNFDVGGVAFDCGGGQLNSQGYNLVQDMTGCTLSGDTTGNLNGVDPLLGPLADNGGPTRTHLPQAGSPAIDAGDPADCPATDQRGFPRPVDGDGDGGAACDIGAVEFGASSAPGQVTVYLPLVVR